MDVLTKFIEEYENLKVLYPQLYVSISNNKGIWRVSLFGKDMAIIGDAEFMTVESSEKDEVFKKALVRSKTIPTQIAEAMALKRSGRKIYVKRA